MSQENLASELQRLLERFAGRRASASAPVRALDHGCQLLEEPESGLGWSQLNELLLLLGLPRVSRALFQFLIDASTEYRAGNAIESFDQLKEGIVAFQTLALLLFGNVEHGFDLLCEDESLLTQHLELLRPADPEAFTKRHQPVFPIDQIDGPDTFLLGYRSAAEIQKRLRLNPHDQWALDAQKRRPRIIAQGKHNQEAYLASDHLDIYVATSMRRRHEFLQVSRWTQQIFGDSNLTDLNLRYFDPTQAYCESRIDKGLAEALMLKRAKGTLYFAQESDTFGKDSELASTLAQGKPVVIYVPHGDDHFVEQLLEDLAQSHPEKTELERILDQLEVFDSSLAWDTTNSTVRQALHEPNRASLESTQSLLTETVRQHYEKRARTLRDLHPLGIQVHLDSGVANGVLVARTLAECACLLRRIVLNQLEYVLEDVSEDGSELRLRIPREIPESERREDDAGSIFRVQTRDKLLTHAFWSFYTRKRPLQ